jgi:hypothetical protein
MSSTTTDWRMREPSAARGTETRDYESTPSLLRRLVYDVSTLFAQEIDLLKAETTKSIYDMKRATTRVAMGGAVLFMGLFFVLLAAVYGLSTVVAQWLAALIVGGAVTLIGFIMLLTGRRQLEPAAVAPRRTAASLRKDTDLIKGVAQDEHK